MNSKKVKALRKQVYGEYSHRIRQYKWQPHEVMKYDGDKKPFIIKRHTLINTGLRKQYQDLKKSYTKNFT